ncbi:anthranilate phosphoribosyltransferase [Acetobacter senegalensis]|uniref:anthranilate phosphoribosyltransferase n=1 Tax=Acetobacter senegalensis TaxID=446692 RepID=UPI001ED9F315|nr:anthranilate phosphoribosyltransferase [Acetobacter senegalensis]MCG4271780.1 anthranilate phosphoribosyltransferase [Acetobacter senegalensis]
MSETSFSRGDNQQDAFFSAILVKLSNGLKLTAKEAEEAFGAIVDGSVSAERIAAFLMALRVRGESGDELLGAVTALRARMLPVPHVPAGTIDVCGTGGDNYGTLNVSTATAFVLAALGIPVAKHGNRAVSSQSGASDVLGALGVPLSADPQFLSAQLNAHHLVFLAAPHHHPAMRHAAPTRKALGVRTLFNLIGPLVNPAGIKNQLVGVFSVAWLSVIVDVLAQLGSERVWAVCGKPAEGGQGIDEVTLAGPTQIVALENGQKKSLILEPEMAGFAVTPVAAIKGGSAAENAAALEELLRGATGPYRDTVLLNAACALHVAGHTTILRGSEIDTQALRECIAEVSRPLTDGTALAVLNGLRTSSSKTHAENMTG